MNRLDANMLPPIDSPKWNETFKVDFDTFPILLTRYIHHSLNGCHLSPLYFASKAYRIKSMEGHPIYSKHLTDTSLRDQYGKHLFHYLTGFKQKTPQHVFFSMKDEETGRYPIQLHHLCSYKNVNIFGKIPFDYHAQVDRSGKMFLHQALHSVMNEEEIKLEAHVVAFDFSGIEPQFVTLQTIYNEETCEWKINRYPLPKMENGDDISHDMARKLKQPYKSRYNFQVELTFMHLLINRGLRLDKTRNNNGETAWDILQQAPSGPICPTVLRTLKKGISKSKAKMKFSIKTRIVPLSGKKSVTTLVKEDERVVIENPENPTDLAHCYAELYVTKYFEKTPKKQ